MVPVPGGHQLPCCSSGSGAGAGAPTGQTCGLTCLLRRACRFDRQSDSVPESGMVRACGESSAFRVGAGHREPDSRMAPLTQGLPRTCFSFGPH